MELCRIEDHRSQVVRRHTEGDFALRPYDTRGQVESNHDPVVEDIDLSVPGTPCFGLCSISAQKERTNSDDQKAGTRKAVPAWFPGTAFVPFFK